MLGDKSKLSMVTSFLSGKGISAEQAVRLICQKRGIDVDAFMSQIKS